MSGWMAAILAALGFMFLIVMHELGHFIAAKKTGMRVERFSLFFGPMIFKRTKGETTYGIGVVPLGGYVKITGMNPDEHFETPDVEARAYYHQPVWKRIVVIGAGPAVNLLIAFVLLFGLAFTAVEATDATVVGQIQNDSAASGVLKPDDKIVSVDGKSGDQGRQAALIDAHRCAGTATEDCKAATPVVLGVIRDGKPVDVKLYPRYDRQKIDQMRLGFSFQGTGNTVGQVDPKLPAAGILRDGDKIVAIDGKTGNRETLIKQVGTHQCAGKKVDGCRAERPVVITVERDGRERTFTIRPVYQQYTSYMNPGFAYGKPLHPDVFGAVDYAVSAMWKVTTSTVTVFSRIIEPEQRKQLSGVVGTYESTRLAIKADWRLALTILALISLALAIINLFPFLPLDGGHIFWSLVEKVKGSPVPFRIMEQASAVGFVLVLMLFAIGLTNDIGRLNGEGFGVR